MSTGCRRLLAYDNDMRRAAVDPASRRHPTVSRDLDAIIARILELDPQKRYGSVLELIPDIELREDAI